MTSSWAIIVLILGPLVAAALAFAFPKRGRWVALAAAVTVIVGLMVLTRDVLASGVQMHRVGGWSAPLGIDLRADGLAVLMLAMTMLIAGAVTLYAPWYFLAEHDAEAGRRERYFWPLFLFLWTALNALFLSADIFNLYVTLELLGLAAVSLVALAGRREALLAAMRYLFVSLSASLFYLLGVALVYGQCATVDISLLTAKAQPGPTLWVALALMTGGLIAKAALFPMHFWLPPAHANAPAPVSALLSALVVKGSFYILLRLWFEAFPALLTPVVAQGFGVLGAAAILWGSVNALRQPRLKLLVAYSTVAQLGYLFLLFPLAASREGGLLAWSGGLVFLGAHACAKAAMFLTAGNILHAAGHDRIKDLDGITHVLPISAFAFGLAGLSLVGLPPSSGFAGKWMLLSASLAQGQWWWVAVLLVGSLLAAGYVLRVLTHAFTKVSEARRQNPIPPVMEGTALALAVLAVGLGLAARWPTELLRVGTPPAVGGRMEEGIAKTAEGSVSPARPPHDPGSGRARLLPSRRPVPNGPARQEARPTGFKVTGHGLRAKVALHEPAVRAGARLRPSQADGHRTKARAHARPTGFAAIAPDPGATGARREARPTGIMVGGQDRPTRHAEARAARPGESQSTTGGPP